MVPAALQPQAPAAVQFLTAQVALLRAQLAPADLPGLAPVPLVGALQAADLVAAEASAVVQIPHLTMLQSKKARSVVTASKVKIATAIAAMAAKTTTGLDQGTASQLSKLQNDDGFVILQDKMTTRA
jgi:hypothetical protein